MLVAHPSEDTLLTIERRPRRAASDDVERAVVTGLGLDVVFPVLHGPYGEDGTVQGLLELANVPVRRPRRAGLGGRAWTRRRCGCMFAARGLPVGAVEVVPAARVGARPRGGDRGGAVARAAAVRQARQSRIERRHLESQDERRLAPAIEHALRVRSQGRRRVGVPEAREIECAVLGNDEPQASVPGEIIPAREFYDYEAKYLDEGSRTVIPADLAAEQTADVQRLAIAAFRAIDAAGMSRVDFLLSRATGAIYRQRDQHHSRASPRSACIAKMWEASGVGLSGAGRSADSARPRAPRRQTAPADERDVNRAHGRGTGHQALRGGRCCRRSRSVAVLVAATSPISARAGTGSRRLTAAPALSRAYDAVLNADFEHVAPRLSPACPAVPEPGAM